MSYFCSGQAPEPPPRRMRFVRWTYRDAGLDLAPRDRHAPTETMHLALGPALDTNGLGLTLRVRFE